MQTIHRHGIVVIHGQGADRRRADFLAGAVNAIGEVLEAQGGRVERAFNSRVRPATAAITVLPPPDADADPRRYEFVEAYWDDAFPPPNSRVVYSWLLAQGWYQVSQSLRGVAHRPDEPAPRRARRPR